MHVWTHIANPDRILSISITFFASTFAGFATVDANVFFASVTAFAACVSSFLAEVSWSAAFFAAAAFMLAALDAAAAFAPSSLPNDSRRVRAA